MRASGNRVAAVGPAQGGLDEVHRRGSDETADEQVYRMVVKNLRRRELLQQPVAKYGHPVAKSHRLDLVVGDVDGRDGEIALDTGDLGSHLDTQLGVQVRERLVHQEGVRLTHDRPAHRHPLALPARQMAWLPIEILSQPQDPGGLVDAPSHLRFGHLPEREPECDVVAHGQVRVKCIGLENHGDVAIAWGHIVDHPVADFHFAFRDPLESGDHSQRGCLARPGRADEHHELAVRDLHTQIADRPCAVVVHLCDA